MNTQSAAGEVLAIAIHPVTDYATWRAVYDAGSELRARMGVTGGEVFVDPKDPNKVIVLARFASAAAMESFTRHPDLAAAMKKAGVVEPRTIFVGVKA